MNFDTESGDVLLLELSSQVTLDESGLFRGVQLAESFVEDGKRFHDAPVDGQSEMERRR